MNVSLVSYRDLGKDISQPFTTTARVFHQRGILERVYTRGVIQTELPGSRISTHVPVVGRLPFSALYYVDKYLYGFNHIDRSHRDRSVIEPVEVLVDVVESREWKTADDRYVCRNTIIR